MSLQSIIESRRTIKKFKHTALDESKLKQWLTAAAFAPNHKMTEPWEIVFVGEETRAKLNHKTNFGGAPTLLAITSKHGKTALETAENYATVSCFIQNLLLLAWEEGVGSFWSSVGASEAGQKTLQITEDEDLVGVIALGYPEEIPPSKERTDIDGKVKHLS